MEEEKRGFIQVEIRALESGVLVPSVDDIFATCSSRTIWGFFFSFFNNTMLRIYSKYI